MNGTDERGRTISRHPGVIVLATTALLFGLAPTATAEVEGKLVVLPARGAAGSHVEVRIQCPTDELLSYRPLVPVASAALAVAETGSYYYPTSKVLATVRPVAPGRYSVSVTCEGRGGNGLVFRDTLTSTFSVVPKTAPRPTTPSSARRRRNR
ncbi:hypothetical protein ACGFMK_40950 [Amycolatopsis sp. NPDC049252]|uniref:hypothetical protein n=1 Tax=Amycolatopsis sp. NPDC049252 TaxID=3363933 RepID=UPI00371380ED